MRRRWAKVLFWKDAWVLGKIQEVKLLWSSSSANLFFYDSVQISPADKTCGKGRDDREEPVFWLTGTIQKKTS